MDLLERWACKTEEYEAIEELFEDERLAEYADAVDSLRHEARRRARALERLRAALEFYAEEDSEPGAGGADGGQRALAALRGSSG